MFSWRWLKATVLQNITPCSLVKSLSKFPRRVLQPSLPPKSKPRWKPIRSMQPWRWSQYVPPKFRAAFATTRRQILGMWHSAKNWFITRYETSVPLRTVYNMANEMKGYWEFWPLVSLSSGELQFGPHGPNIARAFCLHAARFGMRYEA
jgi:hypothetical protein